MSQSDHITSKKPVAKTSTQQSDDVAEIEKSAHFLVSYQHGKRTVNIQGKHGFLFGMLIGTFTVTIMVILLS
ncbi:hypothetical protein [Shimia marina]|uniref:Uncharacterized protein n=1 Tax=Shimia marina TaxID=321267 RepID=A0A0P1FD04_9RHOB|nr:hypothetical protein [Shimia marina]CUH52330.1 hypothetical protein SHM7688_01776 [Shimia marina]SFE08914.1 hypothetical protein SAMN04488037_10598 [Shimia marina]